MDSATPNGELEGPVILLGRGGSGTRILSRFAQESGLFLGNSLNRFGDSLEWAELIYRLVDSVGGQRDLARTSRYRGEIRRRSEQILDLATTPRLDSWGFKLPETMLVLPLFMDAFPGARIVHLVRHPVSSSLRRTHLTSRLGNPVGDVVLPAAYRFGGKDPAQIKNDAPYLHNAHSWQFQVSRVLDYIDRDLDREHYREFKYEEICLDPLGALLQFQRYLGLECRPEPDHFPIDARRVNRWQDGDARAARVWELCGETARRLGYTESDYASGKDGS